MLIIAKRNYGFNKKNIWFSDLPYDVPGVAAVYFYACQNAPEKSGFFCRISPTLVIDLDQDLEIIWKRMAKKSCRYFIKRGLNMGIDVRMNVDFGRFARLYSDFVKEKKIPTTPEDMDFMKRYCTLFTAWFDGELLSGVLLLEDARRIRVLSLASTRLHKGKRDLQAVSFANRLVIWEAIRYAKDKGLREFDLGGYYVGEDQQDPRLGINAFKEKFGGQLRTYYTCWKYYSPLYACLQFMHERLKALRRVLPQQTGAEPGGR